MITTRLERLLHTENYPEGLPYRPPPPKKGRRNRIGWPNRVTERWVAEGDGHVGRGRTRAAALAARRAAATAAS